MEIAIQYWRIIMEQTIKDFKELLEKEYGYLKKIKIFLKDLPPLISQNKATPLEFQNFIEYHEVEMQKFSSGKESS